MRLIGLDPGLRHTGWGIIEVHGNRLVYIADGRIDVPDTLAMAERLMTLHDELEAVLLRHRPAEAAVEETFVNKNASSTLKLGLARGIAMLVPARVGIPVAEYSANVVKKSVVGTGHAGKQQVEMMVRVLLPGCLAATPDAADALAVAICHAHHASTRLQWTGAPQKSTTRVRA